MSLTLTYTFDYIALGMIQLSFNFAYSEHKNGSWESTDA